MPVPEGFDYETWLGPRAPRPPTIRAAASIASGSTSTTRAARSPNFGAHSLRHRPVGPRQRPERPGRVRGHRLRMARPGQPLQHRDQGRLPGPLCRRRRADLQPTEKNSYTRFEGTEGWVQYSSGKLQTYPGVAQDDRDRPERDSPARTAIPGRPKTSTATISPTTSATSSTPSSRAGPDRAGRVRPPHGHRLSPGQHRHAPQAHDPLGPRAGTSSATTSHPPAEPRRCRLADVTVVRQRGKIALDRTRAAARITTE